MLADEGPTILPEDEGPGLESSPPVQPVPALVIAWSRTEPERVGEVALLAPDARAWVLGRGGPRPDDAGERLLFLRQRPGHSEPTAPLVAPGISRQQVRITRVEGGLDIERVGQCALAINGRAADRGMVRPGDTVLLANQMVLFCTHRPPELPPLRDFPLARAGAFGGPDAGGIVGESPAIWRLRDRLAFYARSTEHILVLGESGAGKELAARAIHDLSARAGRPLVSCSAVEIPKELVEAILFGNARNFPNPGMAERPGLIGEADGSTLFLDEIGEVSPETHAHLLRVLDSGEYHRLGEQRARHSDLRLIGATNRDPGELKHDLLARLTLHLTVPGLPERREDVPLLVRHLLRRAAARSPELVRRFFPGGGLDHGEPRLDPALVDWLLRCPYTHHTRQLNKLLWLAMGDSDGEIICLSEAVRKESQPAAAREETPPRPEPTPEEILACLERCGGNQARAWQELGLSSRFVLYRLARKHGLNLRAKSEGE